MCMSWLIVELREASWAASIGSVSVDCEPSDLSLETKQWAVSSQCKSSIIPYKKVNN